MNDKPESAEDQTVDPVAEIIAIIRQCYTAALPEGRSARKQNGGALPDKYSVHIWGGERAQLTIQVMVGDIGRNFTIQGGDTHDLADLVHQAVERVVVR